jgi:hypothetical protein
MSSFRNHVARPARILAMASAAFVMLSVAASAGPVADFERALREAYGDYRAALFQTNAKNAPATLQTLKAFSEKWAAIAKTYGAVPPPQYADDGKWPSTLASVAALLKEADGEARQDRLAKAHDVLEKIRDEIEDLHRRNGVVGFSDRMNAFHAYMEHVLEGKFDNYSAGGLVELREQVAVLDYLAGEIRKNPAPEAQAPDYGPAFQALADSVSALQQAARAGDAAAAKAAMAKIKPAYSKMFLKFG